MNWPIRPMEPGDRGYVLDTWRRFSRNKFPMSEMSPDAFSKYMARVHAVVGVCPTLVCHDPEDPTLIYGFITYDPILRCIHMVNVRNQFRGHNIGTALVRAALGEHGGIKYSMHVKQINRLLEKWGLDGFDPYLLEGEV